MNTKKPDTHIECDLCKGHFNLTRDLLKEVSVILEKEGFAPHEVVLTFLECPICGKRYIVIMDDAKTLALAEKLRNITLRQYRAAKLGKPSSKLEEKYRDAKWKLNFNRQKLAEKYYGSFYQLEGTTEQLDYRYHAR